MITRDEILMGRDKNAPLTEDMEGNLTMLLDALNRFRASYGKPMIVTSGYRPPAINAAVGGARKSNHMLCLAADFRDTDGSLDAYCMKNIDLLEACGLWIEDPKSTPGWCHMQAVPPRSGARVFKP